MCGIIGSIAQRDVAPVLLEGLRHLEYRGYDSAGIAVVDKKELHRLRRPGKVSQLAELLQQQPMLGSVGIAHTRWATHGEPNERNAHPHTSGVDLALVHNGIIENHEVLREELKKEGYVFESDTDSETIVHLLHHFLKKLPLLQAVQAMVKRLEGAYAIGVIVLATPDRIMAVRKGSPLVVGLGIGENFIASDPLALLPVTNQFMYLEDGDIAEIYRDKVHIYDSHLLPVKRETKLSELHHEMVARGEYRHFMLKEICEQPRAVLATLHNRISGQKIIPTAFGLKLVNILKDIKRVQIIACGTSYHAGLVARYWLESLAKIPTQVEVASEWRYREPVVEPNTLCVLISQSGETADTLAALKLAEQLKFAHTLSICNVAESSLVRAAEVSMLTFAGPEIGVASTKAFTTQLVNLLLLTLLLAKKQDDAIITALHELPEKIEHALSLNNQIATLAKLFADKKNALFLGRGAHYPIALEGALKLKEISYIHAEAYPAGELKHGPLALVDKDMPVIALVPNDGLTEKLKSNLHEVRARGGQLILFSDHTKDFIYDTNTIALEMPKVDPILSPLVYVVPLQLLSYHVAVLKGTDIDQPRNLAKSVTVE